VFDLIGQDMLPSVGSVTSDSAIERGERFALTDSLTRMQELSNIRKYADASPEDRDKYTQIYNTIGSKRLARHGKGRYDAPDVPWSKDKFDEKYPDFANVDIVKLSPEEANKQYGIKGHLSFSEPVSNLEAHVLNQRKEQEVKFNYNLEQAYGMEFAKGMSLEMGMALIDPVTIPLYFIPPLGAARLMSIFGMTATKIIGGKTVATAGARAIQGGLGGFYGSALAEPFILSAATQEQADYGLAQSAMNVVFGTFAGGGLHVTGGAVLDKIRHVRAKRHAAAFNSASKQLAEGKSVEVTPLTNMSDEPEFKTPVNNADEAEFGSATTFSRTIADGDSSVPHQAGDTQNYKPHGNADESIKLMRQADKGMKLSGIKLKQAMDADPEFAAAVAQAQTAGVKQKAVFKIRTAEGDHVVPKEGDNIKLFDTDEIGSDVGDPLDLGEKTHQAMLMNGVDMAKSNIKYGGSIKLEDGAIHHVFDITDAEFNPKMNQKDVVLANPQDVMKLFQGDSKLGAFGNDLAKGQQGVIDELAVFDDGPLLGNSQKIEAFDEQLNVENLQQKGPQQGTQKGGTYIDAATGVEYYVKYPADPNIAKNEFMAATLYRMFGVAFPETKLVADANGEVVGIASRMVNAKTITPDEFANLPVEVRRAFADDFIVDMFLGNWDVVGNAPNFNLMLAADGSVFRIDPGGALLYRAQGNLKPDEAISGVKIDEMTTMMSESKNPHFSKLMKNLGYTQDELNQIAQAKAVNIFQTDQAEINDVVKMLGFSKDVEDKMITYLVGRRQALSESKEFGDIARVAQNTSTKKGVIVANSVNSGMKAIKKLNKAQQQKLTTAEKGFVEAYTGNGYIWLNKVLRYQDDLGEIQKAMNKSPSYIKKSGEVMGMKVDTPEQVAAMGMAYGKRLQDIVMKLKGIDQTVEVWRYGTPYTAFNNVKGLSIQRLTDINTAKAMKGGTVTFKGFTSTGLSKTKASGFNVDNNIVLKIRVPKGMKAIATGKHSEGFAHGQNETELLLPQDTTFVVREVNPTSKAGHFELQLDALRPGETPMPKMTKQQAIKVAQKYHTQPSNAVSDILPDDPDLDINPNQVQETLKVNVSKDLAEQQKTIEELNEMIQAEIMNVDPKYVKEFTDVLTKIEEEGKLDAKMADDLFQAAKAAAVCVRGV
jgi:hypothetical protein